MPFTNPSNDPLRILLVEDDEFDVAVFRRAFRRSKIPCKILRCSRAEEALEALREAEIELDLLVADHHLPGITGLELCRALLDKDAPFALALLTGGGSEQIAIKALKAGVQEYIVKDSNSEFLEILPLILRQVAWRHRDQLARQLAETEARQTREQAVEFLHKALKEVIENDLSSSMGGVGQGLDSVLETCSDPETKHQIGALRGSLDHLQQSIRALPGLMRQAASGLPALDSPNPATGGQTGIVEHAAPWAHGRAMQVLIVQDNPVVASLTASHVESLGLRYVPVSDGRQALEALEREPFDLVLLDIHMPDLDGLETCRLLRAKEGSMNEHLPVLGVSADLEAGEGETCLAAGMDGFVARPVTLEKLRDEIQRLLPAEVVACTES